MKKRKIRFFLDYGNCFWGANYENNFSGALSAEELPLSPDVQQQVNQFLREYDQHYDWGCPPSEGWTAEDCQRFNREYKRILDLVMPQLAEEFVLCQEQLDLIEDTTLLQQFYIQGRDFIKEQIVDYYNANES